MRRIASWVAMTGCALLLALPAMAQLSIGALETNYTIDFDTTVAGVNEGQFAGAGFQPTPTAGQLDSDGIIVTGCSDAMTMAFGETWTTASKDYTRGSSSGGVSSGGVYAFLVSTGNRALGIQPSSADWTPGTIVLKIVNNSGAPAYLIDVQYNVWILNNEGWGNSFNFSHSADNASWTTVSAMDYTSPEVADALGWTSNARSTTIDLNLTPLASGASYYLRWDGDYVDGGGSVDEFGLDDIVIKALPPDTTPPTIVVDAATPSIEPTDATKILVTFNEKVKVQEVDYTLFTVKVNGSPATVSGAAITGDTIAEVTISSPMIFAGDTVLLSYTRAPARAAGEIEDLSGNFLASVADIPVVNNLTPLGVDFGSVENSSPTMVSVTFTEAVHITSLEGVTISVAGSDYPALAVIGDGTDTLQFAIETVVKFGDAVLFSCASGIEDLFGNAVGAIVEESITNNILEVHPAGTLWFYGIGEPLADIGADGDFYLDTASGDLYSKQSGEWVLIGNLQGPDGEPGDPGEPGEQGPVGPAGPAGDAGPTGATGETGAPGAPGKDGSVWYSGEGAPVTDQPAAAQEGDYWVNTVTGEVYQMQDDGTWVKVASIRGPAGTNGTNGIDGEDGAQGPAGEKGDQGNTGLPGATGAKGDTGFSSLMSLEDEAPGDICPNGGKKVLVGPDINQNYVLEPTEVQYWSYVCNGPTGARGTEGDGCNAGATGSLSAVWMLMAGLGLMARRRRG